MMIKDPKKGGDLCLFMGNKFWTCCKFTNYELIKVRKMPGSSIWENSKDLTGEAIVPFLLV